MTPALRQKCNRVRAIANGATINGTYRQSPIAALDAFKADLAAVVDEVEARP